MAVVVTEKIKASVKKGKSKSGFSSSFSAQAHWDSAYRLPLSEIPWEVKTPPAELVALLDSSRVAPGKRRFRPVLPCKALDVACGSGNYSVFLAKKGFDVTGVDVSKNALQIAEKKAKAAGVSIDFVHADARHLDSVLKGRKFGLVLDWCLLHHVAPQDFNAYAGQFKSLLKSGGVLLLACFSDKDAPKAGQKAATGTMGNVLHYRTRKEIEAAYRPLKVVEYQACRLGRRKQHVGHCFVFQTP